MSPRQPTSSAAASEPAPAPGERATRVPRFAGSAVERARLHVVPRRPGRVRRAPFAVLVLAILAGGVVGLLMFNTHMQQSSFYATRLQARADAQVARQQSLTTLLQDLRNPQTLAVRAKRQGMVPSDNPAFLDLRTDKVLGTPAAALAGDAMVIRPAPKAKPPALNPTPEVVVVPPQPATPQTVPPGTALNSTQPISPTQPTQPDPSAATGAASTDH